MAGLARGSSYFGIRGQYEDILVTYSPDHAVPGEKASPAGVVGLILCVVTFSLCLLLPACPATAQEVETLNVRQVEDTAFLPFRAAVLKSLGAKSDARPTNAVALPWRARHDDTSQARYIGHNIPSRWEDQTMVIDMMEFPSMNLLRLAAVSITPVRSTCYRDSTGGRDVVMVTGFRNDSAFVIRCDPFTAHTRERFLQAGYDSTGPGKWQPTVSIPLIDDYDYDGRVELFVHVQPIRQSGVRTLYCLELDDLSVEWSLPVAVNFNMDANMFRLPDSTAPGIIFAAQGSRQGKSDANFDELFKYCSVVDTCGQVISNSIVEFNVAYLGLIAHPDGHSFYLAHEFDPVDPAHLDSLRGEVSNESISDGTFRLSVLDGTGRMTTTRKLDSPVTTMWTAVCKETGQVCVFANHSDHRLRVYDTALTLLAVSDSLSSQMTTCHGPVSIGGYDDALLFSDGIYSQDFEQLARFEFAGEPGPISYDSAGRVTQLLLVSGQQAQFLQIERRGWWDTLTVLYFRYKNYILISLIFLLLGLITTNHYRARTRKNLLTISKQKTELERAQTALREAQAQLVAQEKFRQARDIAGGIAHEIGNALSPIRNAISLLKSGDPQAISPDKLARSHNLIECSASKAIELTRRITEYVHLEEPCQKESVDLMTVIAASIDRHRERIDAGRVHMVFSRNGSFPVAGDAARLEIVLSNLISNALDAVAGAEEPSVEIVCKAAHQDILIEVRDNGIGIPEENLGRIFDFFYSTKPTTGSGVGLAIVRKTVEMHRGVISVQSKPGEGATFRLRFPSEQTA